MFIFFFFIFYGSYGQNTCGNDCTWILHEDGTLRISGNGMIETTIYGNSPFESIKE